MKVLKFSASWCGPCKMMAPVIEEFKKENKDVEIEDIDIDTEDSRIKEFNVMGVPTFIIVNEDGNKVASRSGFMPKAAFADFIESNK